MEGASERRVTVSPMMPTAFATGHLRAMVAECCKELSSAFRAVREMRFGDHHGGCRQCSNGLQ